MPGRVYRLVGTALALCCWTQASLAQDPGRKVTATFIESPIVMDGILDEAAWSLAEPTSDFIQKEPRTGEPSSERTEVRILYDDENLYLGVYCFDSAGPEGIVVNNLARDFTPRDNDTFTMVFDTFDDNRNGFILSTNPGGAKRDGQISGDGETRNYDWDGIWYVNTRITELGWQAEIAIPFRTFRFREDEQQVWGLNFGRNIRRKFESVNWSAIPRSYLTSRVSMAGELNGLNGIRQGNSLYVKPYVLAPILRREGDDVDFTPDVGLDVKFGVTTGLALDVTVNTDFSQVEADRQQINLTRFPLFFPEKREFFLENAALFQVRRQGRELRNRNRDMIAFFTRRIGLSGGRVVPILGGARLTGSAGKYRLGFLSIQTDEFEELPSTNFSVARVRRDIFNSSDVGGVFINKQGGGEHNRTYGLDNHLRFMRYLEIASFFLKTDTPGLTGQDTAGGLFAGWEDQRFNISGNYLSIEENFNPEVGFVPRKKMRKSLGEFTFKFRPEERIPWIREFRPSTGIEYITDQDNRVEDKSFDQRLSIDFQNGALFGITHRVRFERLDEPFSILSTQDIAVGDYVFEDIAASFSSDRSRMFSGSINLRIGEFFDGHQDTYTAGFLFQPNHQFVVDLSWKHEDVDLPSGDFSTDLVTTRLNYSFSPRMFLNALIQYNSTVDEISSNIRFNFIHKPLSDLFVVYNESRSTDGEVRERALIAKLTYIFDF